MPVLGTNKSKFMKETTMANPSQHPHGEMPVEGHDKTYAGFIGGSVWGGGIILLLCLYSILTFAAHFAWIPSLVGTFVVGILYGMALKMKTGWYATVFGLAVFAAIVSILITALH